MISTIESLAPYRYYGDNSAINELHTAYTDIFDPVNTRGTWKSVTLGTELLELTRSDNETDFANKLGDHLYAHYNYSVRTNAFQCHHEAFFTTPEGVKGLCPAPAQIGDKIVVLSGGSVPYLIRTKEEGWVDVKGGIQYEFVGECFLDGYMYGKAVQEGTENGEFMTEVFHLV
jgi:hypothetical protein